MATMSLHLGTSMLGYNELSFTGAAVAAPWRPAYGARNIRSGA